LKIENVLKDVENEIVDYFNHFSTTYFFYDFLKYLAIPFLIITVFTLVLLLLLNRYGFEKKIILKQNIDVQADDFLTEIIFSEYNITLIREKIKQFIEEVPFKKKWCRNIILNKIITIKQNINGVNPNLILLIYKSFGFHNFSKNLIMSRKWRDKLLGIYHYQTLEYKIKTGYIRPYIDNNTNKFLNSNALIAVMVLSDNKFELLSNYQKVISKADELKILDIIYQKKSSLPTKINDWLFNKNSSVVILGIKLMVRYRETLKNHQISYLLSSPDILIRKETLLAIRNLYIVEVNDLLIKYYSNEANKRNKISALKTFGIIGDDKTKDFIANILLEENDLEIKFEMVNCINKIDPSFFNSFKVEDLSEKNIINRILLHAKTPYLN
jgi:hypothetical protein